MQTIHKRYLFTLRTLAPVHIGSGEIYTQKEYIYENKQYYFPDMGKLYQAIVKHGDPAVAKFEGFLMQSGNKNSLQKPRLSNFLNDANIKDRDFGGYYIKATGQEISEEQVKNQHGKPTGQMRSGNLNDIASFIKDPYGNPYIPGSSLKGAIRTILVNEKFKKDNNKDNRFNIPWGASNNKPFNDIFNNIRVSDSQALAPTDLILAQKIDFSKIKRVPNPLPIHRESIKPFTEVNFTITVVGEEAISLMDNLGAMARSHDKEYQSFFLTDFPEKYNQEFVQPPLYLGAGSGVWTKTLLSESDTVMKSIRRRTERTKTKMVGKGVLKLTKAQNVKYRFKDSIRVLVKNDQNFFEMGKCMFVIKSID